MKETEPIKLRKRKDKTVFLDTVVFGVVFLVDTEKQLKEFMQKIKEDMKNIWGEEKTYVTINYENLPSTN